MFAEGIVARGHLPDWGRVWSDCVQNEIRKSHGGMVKQEEEENVALAAKGKKGKSKQGASTSGKKGKGNRWPKKKTCPK